MSTKHSLPFWHGIWQGFYAPFLAVRFILKDRRLLLLSLAPILLTIVLLWLLTGRLQNWLSTLTTGYFSTAIQWLGPVIWIFVSAIILPSLSGLISLPVLDFLAEESEKKTTLKRITTSTWSERLKILLLDLKKTIFSLFFLSITIILHWIPGTQWLTIWFHIFFLTLTYCSYPQSRRAIGLRKSILECLKNPDLTLGFGLALTIGFAIPVLSAFFLPVAVVGGTICYSKFRKNT